MAELIGIGLLLVGAGIMMLRRKKQSPCVHAHSETGLNYPWLAGVHGGLDHIQYEEPAGSGVWKPYTDAIWAIHCKVISHDPAALVDAHVKAFVDPATRFARLAFFFRDGTVTEPTREWYQLEADYFSS
jgi:hypothetical protein